MAVFSISASVMALLGIAIPVAGMAQAFADGNDDAEMIKEILDGNPAAYQGLVERYQGRIYNVIYGMVRNRQDAQELAQDAFIKAYKNLPTFRLESKFYTWLCRIAMNQAIDFLRKQKHRKTLSLDENIATRDGSGDVSASHMKDDPHRNLESKQTFGRIIEEVEKLPPEQKQAIVLREIDGLSYREISDVMGIPEGTVMSRLYYARKKLQESLKDLREG
jgi:RNA polymerase sigma-70 factor, ECF subfamily